MNDAGAFHPNFGKRGKYDLNWLTKTHAWTDGWVVLAQQIDRYMYLIYFKIQVKETS